MTAKEKLAAALAHKEGPVPLDLGSTAVTGIHCSVVEGLRAHYGLNKHPVRICEPYQMLGLIEDDLKEAMGVDTDSVWGEGTIFGFTTEGEKEWRTPWGQTVLVPKGFCTAEGPGGDVLIYAKGDTRSSPAAKMPASGYFFDSLPRGHTFDENAPNVEDNLEEFGPLSEKELAHFAAELARKKSGGRALVGNVGGTAIGDIALVPGVMLTEPKGLRDISEWYMATLLHPEYLHAIFTAQTELALQNLEAAHRVLGEEIQVCYVCGTDFGTQRAPFCSGELFDELYAPYYRRINQWIHQNTGWKTFKHCCGSVKPLLGRLIDAGFDILNPVQWTADNMEATALKAEFGERLVFWGGGIDTQKTLPFGTPQEVYREALDCCRVFSPGGGFVFGSIHNIQAKTPVENVVAMVNALRDFNG